MLTLAYQILLTNPSCALLVLNIQSTRVSTHSFICNSYLLLKNTPSLEQSIKKLCIPPEALHVLSNFFTSSVSSH